MSDLPTYRMTDFATRYVAAHRRVLRGNTASHWHDCCEVELVLRGGGTHIINGIPHAFAPGDLYMFTPADHHEIFIESEAEILGIMFEESRLDAGIFSQLLAAEAMGGTLLVRLPAEDAAICEGFFRAIIREESPPAGVSPFGELFVGHLLDCIAVELLHRLPSPTDAPENAPIREALLYLYRHYTEPVRLTDIADLLHLHRSVVSKLFRDATGKTFRDCLIDLRLAAACRMLTGTAMSVTDICYASGFETYSHFMRTFRAHFGISPLTFRREHAAQNKGGI